MIHEDCPIRAYQADLTSLSNRAEAMLFRELAKEGLHTNKRKPFADRSFEGILGMREYDLGDVTVNALMFNPNEEEAEGRCRLVQTGTKEVPVFEMKCD